MKKRTHSVWKILLLLGAFCCAVQPLWAATEPEPGEEQLGNIHGTVRTADGAAAPAVNILLKGTNKNAQTDDNGHYTLRHIAAGNYSLVISLMGYAPVEKAVTVQAGKNVVVDILLEVSNQQLKEVTIAGNKSNRYTRSSSNDVGKMPLNRLENPQSYAVIPKELLNDQIAITQDDALQNATGLTKMWDAVGRPGSGGSFYTLRGFITSSNFRNGMPGTAEAKIDNVNTESIEVLKGPSATLFGSSLTSYGGLINRVTKKPYDSRGGEVAYTTGSYGLNRLSADLNTPLDSAHQVLFRLNTAYTTQNSWQDNGFSKNLAIAPSLTYNVNDRLSFQFDAEIYNGKSTGFPMFFFPYWSTVQAFGVSSADKLNIDYYRSYNSNDQVITNNNYNFFGEMRYKLSDNWTSRTLVTTSRNSSEGAMSYFYLLPGNDSVARMTWKPEGYDNSLDIQENINGDFKIGSLRNRLVVGLDFYHYNSNIYYREFQGNWNGTPTTDFFDVVPLNGNSPNYGNFNHDKVSEAYNSLPTAPYAYTIIYKTNTYSAYASDVLNITDRLTALLALRFDYFDNKGSYNTQTGKINPGTQYDQKTLSPKFGLVYQVVKDKVSLFGNYQNGFTNVQGTDSAGNTFKPEQANQWEGGVKTALLDGKLNLTVSYYDIAVKDIVRSDPDHPNFSIQNGTQKSKGIEGEIAANPISGLNIIAGYAYNDSKYERSTAITEGRRPSTAGPANLANLWISYRIPAGAVKGLGFGFGGNYASDNKIINSTNQGVFILPSYTVMNASISYDRAKYRLALKMNNLTDKKYYTGYSTINPQMLRQVVGSISLRF
ncbi:iron complex outermembrane recepter protein [Chitinophaga costaii]|uniref:Iron complex outermembrane recepter protein n=1 Tax=Chitinophaga costaii TaxID=1335309 RepID=A0A1C3YXR9_9BACT|nr:TonB-dependent receptor [Chitinophaga costaii]PUZ30146.1 TonB-dependent siderophore receptor [Chitinophaga costaii]SCB74907.1 iron complex outermembrane recepter protein [Chitinophaga costaii]